MSDFLHIVGGIMSIVGLSTIMGFIALIFAFVANYLKKPVIFWVMLGVTIFCFFISSVSWLGYHQNHHYYVKNARLILSQWVIDTHKIVKNDLARQEDIKDSFHLIVPDSKAQNELASFYGRHDPLILASSETVLVDSVKVEPLWYQGIEPTWYNIQWTEIGIKGKETFKRYYTNDVHVVFDDKYRTKDNKAGLKIDDFDHEHCVWGCPAHSELYQFLGGQL